MSKDMPRWGAELTRTFVQVLLRWPFRVLGVIVQYIELLIFSMFIGRMIREYYTLNVEQLNFMMCEL